jgi:SAM-dependent methyltransferase
MVEYPFVLRELNLKSGRVLDVGCTSPYNIIPLVLADQGLEVWGIDVRIFKIRHPNFKFIKGDIRKTSFPNSYFERIIAISTIEHIGLRGRYSTEQDLAGDRKAILEMTRILKKGGFILMTIPFGRAKIVDASHRVYDSERLQYLVKDLVSIDKREFYIKDKNGYWVLSEEKIAESAEDALACLKLLKP